MGCGVGDPPNANKYLKKYINWFRDCSQSAFSLWCWWIRIQLFSSTQIGILLLNDVNMWQLGPFWTYTAPEFRLWGGSGFPPWCGSASATLASDSDGALDILCRGHKMVEFGTVSTIEQHYNILRRVVLLVENIQLPVPINRVTMELKDTFTYGITIKKWIVSLSNQGLHLSTVNKYNGQRGKNC